MPKNTNSASRISKLLHGMPGHPDDTSTMEVWASAFSLENISDERKAHVVEHRLGMMNLELATVRAQMKDKNFSESLFNPCITALENACSAMFLNTGWAQVRQFLSGETYLGLAFCSEILDDEEDQIPNEELAEFARRIEELERLLAVSTLPKRLKLVVENHLALIRGALAEYPIRGAKSFRQAARAGIGEVIEMKEEVEERVEEVEIQLTEALWRIVNVATDDALRVAPKARLGNKPWGIYDAIGSNANSANYKLVNNG